MNMREDLTEKVKHYPFFLTRTRGAFKFSIEIVITLSSHPAKKAVTVMKHSLPRDVKEIVMWILQIWLVVVFCCYTLLNKLFDATKELHGLR